MKIYSILVSLILCCCSMAYGAEPIKISGSLGLTGKYGPMSEMVANGLKLWAMQVNEKGGLLGRPIELTVYDDTSSPDLAVRLYEKMIVEDKVDLVFGPYSSVITTAIMPVTEKHGYSVLASGAASDRLWQQGYNHLFGVYIPASRYFYGFLKFLFRQRIEKVAIISADDMFSLAVADGAVKWAGRLGVKVTLKEQFKKGTKDLEDLCKRIRESGAEAIIVGGHFSESVDVRLVQVFLSILLCRSL